MGRQGLAKLFLSIALVVCCVRVALGGSVVTQPPQDVVQEQGAAAHFFCKITGDPQIEAVQWTRTMRVTGIEDLIYKTYKPKPINDTKYTFTETAPLETHILVKKVGFEDAGSYKCTPMSDTALGKVAELVVVEKPLIFIPEKFEVGQLASLICGISYMRSDNEKAKGLSPQLLAWFGNEELSTDNAVQTSPTNGDTRYTITLNYTIMIQKAHNRENFTCGAKVQQSSPSAVDFELYRSELLTVDFLEIAPRGASHIRALGASIMFTCTATGISQGTDPRLEWYDPEDRAIEDRTGRIYIERDENTYTTLKLYILEILATDQGSYKCRGTVNGNRVKQQTHLMLFKDITFDHAPSPQNPVLGWNSKLIECRVSGQPVPTVSWRYKGQKIISGGRYKYLPEGLEIYNAVESDNGIYTCRAEVASNGRLKEVPITVIVHIPPTVTKELGQAEGIEEQEVSLTCKAKGKPEPKYEFYRLNAGVPTPVIPSERIEIVRDLGAINFRPLKKADEGDYMCKAINDAGEAATQGFLKVVVPPRIIDLKNVTELEGNNAKLQCVIKGDPAPSVTFQKHGSSRPYEDGENEGGRVMVSRVADNALELTVKNLSPDDTANYTCKAVNIGGNHSINGTIIVEFKPRFDPDHIKKFWSWPDETRNMTCTALGEPEPVIDWYLHDLDRPIQNNASFKVYKMGRNSMLQVKIRDEDQGWIYGDYQCKAGNKHGKGTTVIELVKATIPGKPHSCEVEEESPTMVILMVQPPEYNGGIEIYGYRIEYESHSQDFKIDEEIKIENLHPSTNYIFRIRAKNDVGVGPFLDYTHTTEAIHTTSSTTEGTSTPAPTSTTNGTTTLGHGMTVEITPGDAEITRRVGSSLELECTVHGLPADVIPRITWYANGNEVSEHSRVFVRSTSPHSKKLYIFDIGDTDRGTYWCEASSGGDMVRTAVSLVVVKDITFYHDPQTQTPWSGTDALIQCEASGDPVPTVWWRKQGEVIESSGRYVYEPAGLRIYKITRADTGLYTCVAEVAAEGRVKETLITVIVR